jgi:amino acid transporter
MDKDIPISLCVFVCGIIMAIAFMWVNSAFAMILFTTGMFGLCYFICNMIMFVYEKLMED